jgi:hypothetical protein
MHLYVCLPKFHGGECQQGVCQVNQSSFMKRVSKANVVKLKVSKRALKFLPVCLWVGGHASVCVFA